MALQLRKKKQMTLRVLTEKGEGSLRDSAGPGVTEGRVRYPLRWAKEGATHGRVDRRFTAPVVEERVLGAVPVFDGFDTIKLMNHGRSEFRWKHQR